MCKFVGFFLPSSSWLLNSSKFTFVSREHLRIIVNLNARAEYERMCVSVQCMQTRNCVARNSEPLPLAKRDETLSCPLFLFIGKCMEIIV